MERGIRLFLEGLLGERPAGTLAATPARVARAWSADLVAGYALDPAGELGFSDAPAGAGIAAVRGVRFASVCEHHLLPFFGVAHVAYLPDRRLAGLSKIGRVVDAHARRLQTQERLTAAIVDTLQEGLRPHGVVALLEAEHTCMTLRGVRKDGSRFVTVAASGVYRADGAARREVLELLRSADR